MGVVDHSSRNTFGRSGTDVVHKGLSNSSQWTLIGLRSGPCAGDFLYTKLAYLCPYVLAANIEQH